MWCGKCYQAPKDLVFHVQKPENDVGLVWSKSGEEDRFLVGIDGAQFVVPFQCDLCWFRNLENRNPRPHCSIDNRTLDYIRRANLDIIWSRAPGTICNSRQGIKLTVQMWQELGITVKLPKLGPWKVEDNTGFRLAIACLRYSQRTGRNSTSHLQFDAVRKLRTAYSNLFEASVEGFSADMLSFRGKGGESLLLSTSPTESKLFNKFMRGLLLRMGRQTKVDFGLSIDILHAILTNLETDLHSTGFSTVEKRYKTMLGAYLIVGFVCALRGNEGFMLESSGLQSHIDYGRFEGKESEEHVVMPLLGRFKNEDGEGWHLMVSVSVTESGLEVRKWLERLVLILRSEGKKEGPAFCNVNGSIINYWKMNDNFVSELQRVQNQYPNLFEKNIEISEVYSIYRSLRRGSTARATEAGVSATAIDLHNRWRSIEAGRGQRSRKSMRDYYTDLKLTIKSRLSYSKAL